MAFLAQKIYERLERRPHLAAARIIKKTSCRRSWRPFVQRGHKPALGEIRCDEDGLLPAEAYDCFMVWTPYGFNRIQAWFARLIVANDRLPSDYRAANHPIAGEPAACQAAKSCVGDYEKRNCPSGCGGVTAVFMTGRGLP